MGLLGWGLFFLVHRRIVTLAIGDATSDFLMADYVDTFFLVENGLKNPTAEEFLATHDNAFVTRGRIVDGWVQGMRCLLAALA